MKTDRRYHDKLIIVVVCNGLLSSGVLTGRRPLLKVFGAMEFLVDGPDMFAGRACSTQRLNILLAESNLAIDC